MKTTRCNKCRKLSTGKTAGNTCGAYIRRDVYCDGVVQPVKAKPMRFAVFRFPNHSDPKEATGHYWLAYTRYENTASPGFVGCFNVEAGSHAEGKTLAIRAAKQALVNSAAVARAVFGEEG